MRDELNEKIYGDGDKRKVVERDMKKGMQGITDKCTNAITTNQNHLPLKTRAYKNFHIHIVARRFPPMSCSTILPKGCLPTVDAKGRILLRGGERVGECGCLRG